ncbi:AraC family transcriptional regulator [Tetragenococcus halophilus]|uniref:AraC family transcriptional regulator n=1 Tax=Tetragenococcus halophilus TaxID=51669 RepID=A0A3G5FKS1_TETHA|nr:AraC family ligand binding domain-containing protein [Tetragenococcus halophilus]AYW50953.1 AraC family transcriptional regulator [Tetragenococcus halophilus]GBD64250.1 hypothetical protein TEHD23766T_1677 [Tetragenococcus halophilus subsp. flandriensis]GMG62982.1 AraC family transcriptional regulator [Tetragenococcus halophilus]
MENAMYLLKQPKNYEDLYFSFCGFSKTQPKHSFGPAIRDTYLIHIVLEGKGYYSIEKQNYYLKSGQGFVIPPGIPTFYQADNEEPWSYVWMGIGGNKIVYYLEKLGIDSRKLSFDIKNIEDFKSIVFQCLAYEKDNLINEITLQKQAYNFIELLSKSITSHKHFVSTRKMNSYVSKSLEMISKYAQYNISVGSIAQKLSIDPSYLSRLFTADIGVPIKKYINEIRITTSNDLLTSTDYSISQISEMVGFSSTQAYSKAFKQFNGVSPSIYRKKRIGFEIDIK